MAEDDTDEGVARGLSTNFPPAVYAVLVLRQTRSRQLSLSTTARSTGYASRCVNQRSDVRKGTLELEHFLDVNSWNEVAGGPALNVLSVACN